MGIRGIITVIVLALVASSAAAQCPSVSYTLPATACLNANIPIANGSASGTYEWDFCTDDFNQTPTSQFHFQLAGTNGRPGFTLAKDGNTWYGFATSTFTNTLWRVTFGNGLQSSPTLIENLGDLSGTLNAPGQVAIFTDGSAWYGLIYNAFTGDLVKLSFGSFLRNTISTSLLSTGISAGESTLETGLAVRQDGVNGWVAVLTAASKKIVVLRLGASVSNPGPSDNITLTVSANKLGDVDLFQLCGQWYGFAADFGNGNIYRLSFGASLFSTPVMDVVTNIGIPNNPGRIRAVAEGKEFFLFVPGMASGQLTKVRLGTDITTTSPTVVDEGSFSGALSNGYGLAMIKENSQWTMLVLNQGTGTVNQITYTGTCSAGTAVSTAKSPVVSYAQPGTYTVSLAVTSGGKTAYQSSSVTVNATSAPDISINVQNQCALNPMSFTSQNLTGDVSSYAWDFGDGNTSNLSADTHVYNAAGTYTASLDVTAVNGCTNHVQQTLTVYNPPVATFSLPPASPVCTNGNYTFANTSSSDTGSNPAWEWRVNDVLVSTNQNLNVTFANPVSQKISLKALLAGCASEDIQTIGTVLTGPTIDFTVADNCEGVQVPFTNLSTGADAGYQWDFGDGGTSVSTTPTHAYATPTSYQVSLTGSNSLGCQFTVKKSLTVFSKPAPDFSISLPPFSCNLTSTPFQNTTPPLTDSSINSWAWQFGDAANGSSALKTPSYTYQTAGTYNVTLTATSSAGCQGGLTKSITIASSPTANFTSAPACVNQLTRFTDLSTGGVQSRLWQIGSSTFTTTNPGYTFTAPGTSNVTLTVTAANGCANVLVKPVNVPVPPTLAFTTSNLCAAQNSVFTDSTIPGSDAIAGYSWNFAGNTVTGNPASFSFLSSGSYNVKLTTTHASGCQYTSSNNMTVQPSPVAAFTASPDKGSAPLTVQFTNQSTGATTYQWTFRDKVVATSTRPSPAYTFASLGDYTTELLVSNAQGCSDKKSTVISVVVPQLDLVMTDFALVTDAITGKLRAQVTIQNNSNIPMFGAEVALYLADKAVVNENLAFSLQPGQSATQLLSFTLSSTQFDFGYLCAGILLEKDVQQANNRKCLDIDQGTYFFPPYPNPTSGSLQLDWIEEAAGQVTLTIVDSRGQAVYRWETPSQAGLNQSIHDLSGLTAGLYIAVLQTTKARKTLRFMRQ